MNNQVEKVLDRFSQINQHPRKSKSEAEVANWLLAWAKSSGLDGRKDEAGNVIIKVPATAGYEGAPVVVLQGHMDMVCEKTPGSTHDFARDPITMVHDGDWLRAQDTTLGADNGIAIAMAMVASTEDAIQHPALELLFTVDEESGLTGALKLDGATLTGRILLNLDSEDEGIFTIGSAGGRRTILKRTVSLVAPPKDGLFRVVVDGLQGGHSGVDITSHRANSNKLLARLVRILIEQTGASLLWFETRAADNAIPRYSSAVVFIPRERGPAGAAGTVGAAKGGGPREIVAKFEADARNEYRTSEPGLRIAIDAVDAPPSEVLSASDAAALLDMVLTHPHGILRMSPEIDGLVQTSANLAACFVENGDLSIVSLQRSSVQSELDAVFAEIAAVARLGGATMKIESEYPGWEPRLDSPLLAKAKAVYRNRFGRDPVVEAVHAGLECGVIGGKYPGMDMISFGPTILAPHSPDERLNLPSLEKAWQFLTDLLASLAADR